MPSNGPRRAARYPRTEWGYQAETGLDKPGRSLPGTRESRRHPDVDAFQAHSRRRTRAKGKEADNEANEPPAAGAEEKRKEKANGWTTGPRGV